MCRWLCVALVLVGGCVRDDLVACGDQLCPLDTECTPGGCAAPEDVATCIGLDDGAACARVEPGTCSGGSCHDVACGNAIIDLEFGEVCDDGNQAFDDGCSADCRSAEVCGNDVVDVVRGEECDRGMFGLAGDGCSSVCTFETEIWREAIPLTIPPGEAVMAYDARRAVTVWFGRDGSGLESETWEYDGTHWALRTLLAQPPALRFHSMVYDAQRQRIVLFGGSIMNVPQADTWEYDGTTWTQRVLPASPPARSDAALAYDPERQVTVLFGGVGGTWLHDTWEYDGSTWVQKVPTGGAPTLNGSAFAFDPITNRLILFGGFVIGGVGGPQRNETWAWDGTRWDVLAPPTPLPSARVGHAMVTDPLHARIVLVGGNTNGTVLNDVWQWLGDRWTVVGTQPSPRQNHGISFDGARDRVVVFGGATPGNQASGETLELQFPSTWRNTTPLTSPDARSGYAMAHDARRGTMLLFGGYLFDAIENDETWEWNGRTWRLLVTPTRPDARADAAIAYDQRRGQMVMFGGDVFGTPYRETWVWNGKAWSQPTLVVQPPERLRAAMAYDAKRDRVVLFGGGSPLADDTWEWDGTTWTERTPAVRPPPRTGHAMTYDPVREVIVLHGGDGLGDLWEWDGTTWTERVGTVTPGPRSDHGMAFDPLRRRVVVSGGYTTGGLLADSTWEWDGTTWTSRTPAFAPPPRAQARLAYDPILRRMMTFSGASEPGETWLRGFEAGGVGVERCIDPAADDDVDGLLGCDDPDCFGRCTPLCIPGLPCDPSPRCGDASCDPVEDFVFCPADCAAP